MIPPEDFDLKGWENRITESLFMVIRLYVEDTHHLPSAKEYREMAQHAIENCWTGGTRL